MVELFANSRALLWLLLLVPLVLFYFWYRVLRVPSQKNSTGLVYSDLTWIKSLHASRGWLDRFKVHLPLMFRCLVIACAVMALALPGGEKSRYKEVSEGLDIFLAIDTSGSMRALDLLIEDKAVDRLTAVKSVVLKFIKDRPADRVGIVVFGEETFTLAPLTLDHKLLEKFLQQVRIGVAGDATAIGDAIATASLRVKEAAQKSKTVILLTDGRNTAGSIDPMVAAEAAKAMGIRIYTIGVGKDGQVPYPITDPFGRSRIVYQESDLDEPLLKKIASETDAQFFRASDSDSLQRIYETIDKLEKAKLITPRFWKNPGIDRRFLSLAMIFLGLELLLALSLWRKIP